MLRSLSIALAVAGIAATPAWSADPPKVLESAKDFELENLAGGKTKLSGLTAEGPVVLIVLRGFPGYQCPVCNTQAADFLRKADELKKAGARVLFVYPGPAEGLKKHADEFTKNKDLPSHFLFLLDPDYTFTESYGLRWNASAETAYPSTFVVDNKGIVRYARVSRTHGGRAKASDVLKALAGLNGNQP